MLCKFYTLLELPVRAMLTLNEALSRVRVRLEYAPLAWRLETVFRFGELSTFHPPNPLRAFFNRKKMEAQGPA